MIKELLNHGAENAVSTEWLMLAKKLTQREVVAVVSQERAAGVPILSSSQGGYYLPDDEDPQKALSEVRTCIRTIQSRGHHTLMALDALRKEETKLAAIAGE